MAKIPVFLSFHYDNDAFRVQQIINLGSIEGNTILSTNEWESIKRTGDKQVEKWIDDNMKYKRCVIVLIGSNTASRDWVKYEIKKAFNDGKALLGIYIHNLKCPIKGKSSKGKNPFDNFTVNQSYPLSQIVPCYDPSSDNAYGEIKDNIENWINLAINEKKY